MTDTPDGGTPAEAIAAVIDMIEDRYDGTICQRDYDVITAAAPVIAAGAAAAQREADIALISELQDHDYEGDYGYTVALERAMDALLAAAPDTTTGKETR